MDANRGSSNKERFPTTLERNLWHSKTTGCDKREKVQTDPQTFSSLKKIVNSGCKKIRWYHKSAQNIDAKIVCRGGSRIQEAMIGGKQKHAWFNCSSPVQLVAFVSSSFDVWRWRWRWRYYSGTGGHVRRQTSEMITNKNPSLKLICIVLVITHYLCFSSKSLISSDEECSKTRSRVDVQNW